MFAERIDVDRLLKSALVAQVEYYATIGSTNDRAKECAAVGSGSLPLLIVAEEQTAGRGRGANRWWTGDGSLAFSLLFHAREFQIERMQSPLIALATGVAVVEAVSPFLPARPVGIRWPNDVYVGDRKLAGLLVEVMAEQYFVVGVGVNVNNSVADAPAEVARTATTLRDLTGNRYDRTSVLLAILDQVVKWLRELAATPETVASRCDSLCLQHGQPVTVHVGERILSGHCVGIAPDGALLVETPTGRQTVYSGVLRHP